jgi:polyadenylate-binding protein
MTSENMQETTTSIPPVVLPPSASQSSSIPFPGGFIPTPTASLYVGELHPDVTESMLFELFNQVGPVSSIRICRDAITRRSLGYAYVNYHNPSDCDRAIDTLNYTPIKGHPCRIMWSQRDPSVRRSGVGNIFIKNLDPSIDNKSLHDTFSAFGNILSCKVVVDERGSSKGYGFVHFETQEAADLAIEKVNGMLLNDRKVYVGRHVPRRERLQKLMAQKASFTNVFVKNLEATIGDEEFWVLFEPFGEITSAVVQRDEAGNSKGFGFINFSTHEAAQKAVEEMNGKEVKGMAVYAGRAQKKAERDEELRRQFEAMKMERLSKFQGVNLYIKNLAESIDDERLRQEFAPYGNITSCRVMLDDKQVSRGFGFVCYSSPEEASRAAVEMNGRMLLGKPLYVSVAQRKDERRAQLEAKYSAMAIQLRYQQATGMGIFAQGPVFYPSPSGAPVGPGGSQRGFRPPMLGPMMGASYGAIPPMRPMRPMRGGFNRVPGLSGAPMSTTRRQYASGPNRFQTGASVQRPQGPLTMASLAAMTPDQQKRAIGDRLFTLVQVQQPEHAAKITGMLLEMDNSELLEILEQPDVLTSKVSEAMEALRQANISSSQ